MDLLWAGSTHAIFFGSWVAELPMEHTNMVLLFRLIDRRHSRESVKRKITRNVTTSVCSSRIWL
jgi:hypothetical protein